MSKLFKAAREGRLEELKKLKEDGAKLSERDKDDNTALLWAAYYGHLDVVKWLLKEGGAKVTESNKLGNTALSLAISHEQLPIVDYLVRTYYISSDLKLDSFSKNRAIRYYFQVVELFSQKEVDYTELSSLLNNASKQLKGNNLTFVHFIYLWMKIYYQAKIPSSAVEILPNEPFVDRLPISYQAELISLMLREGYILNNSTLTNTSQTSSAVDPEDLLRHIVAAKDKELKENPQTADWVVEGVDETSLENIKEAYREKGLNASAEDDFLPGIKPAGFCILQ